MQKFDKNIHKKFKKYLNIKNQETQIEKDFYKKTIKYIKYIKWLPGLKMVGVGNSISMNSATKNSDIDLYIVSEKNTLWLVRIFITLIFQVFGVRKTAKKHSGRFCLSFFSSLEGMDFSKFAIENDIYLYFWIVYFKPILDFDNTYDLFLKKNTSWANFSEYSNILNKNKEKIIYKKNNILNKKRLNIIVNLINNTLKKVFLPKTLKTYKKIGKPFGVIINDNLLKFHNGDIRKKIKEEII